VAVWQLDLKTEKVTSIYPKTEKVNSTIVRLYFVVNKSKF